LFNLLILGIGPLVGNYLGPRLITHFTNSAGVVNFKQLFLIPSFTAVVAAIVLALAFHPPAKAASVEEA
jgi:hypothetical protein